MKTIITSILFICVTLTCNAQKKLDINIEKSNIHWYGYYTFYFGGHDGNINIKEGHLIKTGDKITGGEFVIDMNTITNLDIKKADANASLVDHLKDPDFFDVAKHPEAKLVFKEVKYHDATHMKVTADLTIKGKTNPIEFQAEVNFENKQMTTRFKIDRMKWNVSYNSKMRDGAISDAIGFEVTLSL